MPYSMSVTCSPRWLQLVCLLCMWHSGSALPRRVAIVGGGVGGGFTARLLRQRWPAAEGRLQLDVYEREAGLGGRTQPYKFHNQTIEIGASIMWIGNKYLRDAADDLGLKRAPAKDPANPEPFAVYDGQHFVFNQSAWSVVTLYRMLRRYGLSYWRFTPQPKDLGNKFQSLYTDEIAHSPHATPEELLEAVGLYELTQHSFAAVVQAKLGTGGPAQRFQDELLAAIGRVNYNQDTSLNALAGMVSALPTADSRLFHIEGGNAQIVSRALHEAGANVYLNSSITAIQRLGNGSYSLQLKDNDANQLCQDQPQPYDAIILAAPLEQSSLAFHGMPAPVIPPRTYKRVVTTVVASPALRPSYFGVQKLPGNVIYTSKGARTPFTVIAPLPSSPINGSRLFKLFSPSKLGPDLLSAIFKQPQQVAEHDWHAYPVFNPPERFARFALAEGLVYLNAWENAASAMEMSAVSAANGAALTLQHLLTPQLQDIGSSLHAQE